MADDPWLMTHTPAPHIMGNIVSQDALIEITQHSYIVPSGLINDMMPHISTKNVVYNISSLNKTWVAANISLVHTVPLEQTSLSATDDNVSFLQQPHPPETLFIDVLGIWVTGVCCLLGIAGNVLSFIVLLRTFGRSPMFLVLRAVALSDTFFLASVFVMQTLVNMYPFTGLLQQAYMWRGVIQWAVWPLLMMTQMSTVWLTVLVSIERYIAICFPLRSASLLSLSRIRRAVLALFLFSVLFNVPRYWEYTVIPGEVYEISRSEVGDNATYRYLYMCALYTLLLFLLPLALLVLLNLKLVLALQAGKKQWQTLQSRQRREQTLTVIPLTIVLVFFVCGMPALVVNVIEAMRPDIDSKNFVRFLVVANLLVVLNSACNFIIYCLLGRRFRSQLLVLCRRTRHRSPSYKSVQKLITSSSQITHV